MGVIERGGGEKKNSAGNLLSLVYYNAGVSVVYEAHTCTMYATRLGMR